MKKLALALLMTITLHASSAAQNQPEVDVLKFSWRKLTQKNVSSRNLSPEMREMRDRSLDVQISEEQKQQNPDYGVIADLRRQRQELRKPETPLGGPNPTGKAYEFKFRFINKSAKEVVSLGWIYVFRDAITREQLVALDFNSDAKIKPGKEKQLISYTDSSPPMIVNAEAQQQKGKAWIEEVIITRVVYADGSKWEGK